MAFPFIVRTWASLAPIPYLWNTIRGACPFGISRAQEFPIGVQLARAERGAQVKTVACSCEWTVRKWIYLQFVGKLSIRTQRSPALSSRGLGHRPLKAETRVRIPLALPTFPQS